MLKGFVILHLYTKDESFYSNKKLAAHHLNENTELEIFSMLNYTLKCALYEVSVWMGIKDVSTSVAMLRSGDTLAFWNRCIPSHENITKI